MSDRDAAAARDLTPKQEAFALAYFETRNGGEAYRRAYDVAESARTDNWVYVEAWQLLQNPKVAQRIAELEAEAKKLAIYTRQTAMDELEQARNLAHQEGQAGAAVSAVNSKIKLFGMDRPKQVRLAGPDGGPIQTEDVSARDILARRIADLASRSAENGDTSEPDGGSSE